MELLPAEKAHAAVACVCVPGLAAVQGCVQARRKDGSIEGLAEPWDLEPRGSEDDKNMQCKAYPSPSTAPDVRQTVTTPSPDACGLP